MHEHSRRTRRAQPTWTPPGSCSAKARGSPRRDGGGRRSRYAASLKLKRAAITLYSLGVAQRSNGKLAEALESFRAFLFEPSTAATAPYEPLARDAVADLERRVAHVALAVDPPGVPELAITINGEPVAAEALGVPRLVNPGLHKIVASASGYAPTRAWVTSGEGTLQPVKLKLAPVLPVLGAPLAASPAQAPPAVPATDGPSRAVPISLMVGGGVAVVVGVSVGVAGVKEASDAPTKDGPQARAAKAKALAGDIVTGGGLAAAAGRAHRAPRAPAPRRRAACVRGDAVDRSVGSRAPRAVLIRSRAAPAKASQGPWRVSPA